MKSKCINHTINIVIDSHVKKLKIIHEKKLNSSFKRKQHQDGIKENPNNMFWSITSRTLSNEEYKILCYVLNLKLATHQKESHF